MSIATMLLKAPHIGVRDFKTNLSKFIKRKGPFIVTERGVPVEVMVPYSDLVKIVELIDRAGLKNKAKNR